MNRIISITRNGRFVALRRPGGLDLVDVLGTAPRRHIQAAADAPFTCVGTELWVLEDMLHRFRTTRVDPAITSELPGDDQITSVSASYGSEAISAVASGNRSWWVESGTAVTVRELQIPSSSAGSESLNSRRGWRPAQDWFHQIPRSCRWHELGWTACGR